MRRLIGWIIAALSLIICLLSLERLIEFIAGFIL